MQIQSPYHFLFSKRQLSKINPFRWCISKAVEDLHSPPSPIPYCSASLLSLQQTKGTPTSRGCTYWALCLELSHPDIFPLASCILPSPCSDVHHLIRESCPDHGSFLLGKTLILLYFFVALITMCYTFIY